VLRRVQGVTQTGRSDEDCDMWTECYAVCRVLHGLDGLIKTVTCGLSVMVCAGCYTDWTV